ncbi:ATP-binding protein [Streptomonospora arabica]|uniref:ATP-binding protein n=1 Tax=Streptomonospora arabica TaxID=412417 RepID=A0ABV9SLS9_9ACTN
MKRMVQAWDAVPRGERVELPPDPRALQGLGRNHLLHTALADLVDNAIDAGATDVLIRFVRQGGLLRGLYVVDNGCGMSPATIDTAMTVGGRREYGATDLGHFGLGLQSASFSQARVLTVMSRADGEAAVGRRLRLDGGFHADVVPSLFVDKELRRAWNLPTSGARTVVRWDEVTRFPATDDPERVEEFITDTQQKIRNHLGLVFHRLLTAHRISIALDVEDVGIGVAPPMDVHPVNPFGYRSTGASGYPVGLEAVHGSTPVRFHCHIWPGRSTSESFRLTHGGERQQGLYFYRHDRLLQAGGDWAGVATVSRRLQLARVVVDIDDAMAPMFLMNPEKSMVTVSPEFTALAEAAVAGDGTTFEDYLKAAEDAFHRSNKRERKRRKMVPPGRGFSPELRSAIASEVPFTHPNDQKIEVRWARFESDAFFEVDRDRRVLWLNKSYRKALLGGRRGSVNDTPVLKTLLYLLTEEVFQGERLGPKDKDNLELWQEILTAAARSER